MESLIPSDHREDQFQFRSKFETDYTSTFIDNGAFGTVYKCAPKHCNGKMVAVKLIEILSKYPEQEAKILKKLKHENVLEIISDWLEHPPKKYKYSSRSPLNELTNSVFFIETEFCDLKSLKYWLQIPVPITELQAKIILYQIAKGLEYLHSPDNNIVHRDLKPDNILFCTNPFTFSAVAKIGDFGIARVISVATMTKGVGTFRYMCPEVSSNTVKYKHKVDIYALGVVFCEMLVLGDCSISERGTRDSALCQDMIKENGFSIESCGEYLRDKIEERQLIEDMVRLPGEHRPEASTVITKLLEWCPNICNEKLPIPHIPEKENPEQFRLYGKQTSERFTGIPKSKHVEMLTTLELNFVRVDASHLISCLKECINLRTIEMTVINDGDGLFPKITLPKLRKFSYRQLNGPSEHYPYLTDERLESLLFFGPLEQLWKNKMAVKVIVKKLSIIEIQHEDSQCSIYLTAVEGTKSIYDKLKNFENTIAVYLLDHNGDSEFCLELDKLPGQTCLKTLAVDLPSWNHTVNGDLHKFQNLKELYLCDYSKKKSCAGINDRRLVVLYELPRTIRILSLSDLNVAIQPKSGMQNDLDLESLSLINCTFRDDFMLEKMDSSKFKVRSLNFFINEYDHEKTKIYEPTWELLEFLMIHEECKRFYFGSFQWAVESNLKNQLLPYVERLGVPNNSRMFLFEENNGVWKGKVVERSEHLKLLAELTYRNKFSMPEKDAFRKPERVEILPMSYAFSRIPHFQTHRNVEPAFVLDGSTGESEYISLTGFQNKSTVKKIHLKRVEIDADGFVFNLRGCNELMSLSLENVKVQKRFFGSANLPKIKEFLYILDMHMDMPLTGSIAKFFDVERMKSSLFFNKNSFDDLWSKAINVVIAVDNTRVLEFNHEKGLIWLQGCNYAYDIISKSGLLLVPTQKIKTLIIHDCSGLAALTNFPCGSLTYLNLSKVDVDFTNFLESSSFSCLQSLFLEPNVKSTELDLCKIPPSVLTIGLTSMTVKISTNYTTCDCLTLQNCVLPKDFANSHLPFLRVRKIGLIGPTFFAKHGSILNKLFDDENICRAIYIEGADHDVISHRANRFYSALKSLGLKDFFRFEVSRDSSNEWSSLKNMEDYVTGSLTGSDLIKNQQHPTESLQNV